MIFKGRIIRFISGDDLTIEITSEGIIYKGIFPLFLQEYFSVINREDFISITGNFLIHNLTFIYNPTMKIDIQKGTSNTDLCLIADMQEERRYNLYCVLLDWKEPAKSTGTDYYTTMYVIDESINEALVLLQFEASLKKSFTLSKGDILFVEQFLFQNIKRGLVNRDFGVEVVGNVFRSKIDSFSKEISEKISKLTQFFLVNRNKWINNKEIQELKNGLFVDFIGELVAVKDESVSLTLLNLIDYTQNNKLSKNKHGLSVLCIKIWDELAKESKNLTVENLYHIKNIKIIEKNGELFGNISGSYKGSIIKLDDRHIYGYNIEERRKLFHFRNKEDAINKLPASFLKYPAKTIKHLFQQRQKGFYVINIYIKYVFGFPVDLFFGDNFCICGNYMKNLEQKDCNSCNNKFLSHLKLFVRDESNQKAMIFCNKKRVNLSKFKEMAETEKIVPCIVMYDLFQNENILTLIDAHYC